MEIFSNRTDMASRLKVFCGSIAEMVQSPSNKLHVRFLAVGNGVKSKFSALFTAYRTKTKDEGNKIKTFLFKTNIYFIALY